MLAAWIMVACTSDQNLASKAQENIPRGSDMQETVTSPAPLLADRSGGAEYGEAPLQVAQIASPTIYWQQLAAQLYEMHDIAPSPGWPRHFRQAYAGSPSVVKAKGKSAKRQRPNVTPAQKAPNYKHINWWNHVFVNYRKYPTANNVGVEMGPVRLALLINDRWQTRTMGSSCKGRLSEIGKVDRSFLGNAPTCRNGIATVGVGHQDWQQSNWGYHGWSGRKIPRPAEEVQAVAVWFPARLAKIDPAQPADLSQNDQYVVNVGVDLRTGRRHGLPSIISGRQQKLASGGQWTAVVGHSISMDRWAALCQAGNLPDDFPFEQGCNIPGQ